jgi:two-component system sensor histidine kinase/response regulator
MLAEQIKLNLVTIESKFYEIAISTSKRHQVAIKEDALANIRDTRELLRILDKGGTYQREVDVNLQFEDSVSNPITYTPRPGQSEYVLEIIDLMPKLAEIQKRIEELVVLTAAREDYKADNLQQAYVAVIRKIRVHHRRQPGLQFRGAAGGQVRHPAGEHPGPRGRHRCR